MSNKDSIYHEIWCWSSLVRKLISLYSVFIGPESDHWLCLSLTGSLPNSSLVNLIDVTLVGGNGNFWSCISCWWGSCWQQFGWHFWVDAGWDSENEIWSRFVFELVIWTQPSGALCLWQCFFSRVLLARAHFVTEKCHIRNILSYENVTENWKNVISIQRSGST